MNIQIKYVTILLIFSFLAKTGVSQENFASNISKSISDDEKLLITYDISPSNGAKSFNVVLLLTYQGTQIEASSAYGDLGSNISPGKEKAVVCYFEDDFDGVIEDVEVDVFAYKENEPKAIFEIVSVSNNGYAPCKVVLSNKSSYANEYQWNFGDSGSGGRNLSFEKDPTHVYEKGGAYSIALIARNTQSNLENTYYQSIEIKEHDPTIADFEIEGNNQLAPAKVDFKNKSVNADTYHWNFGDSSSSFFRSNESDKNNPRYKYKNPGTYIVELIVSNSFSGLSDTITKEVVVEQEKEAEANFVYTKSSKTAPSIVTFKNTSVNADKYEWDFGDPSAGDKNSSDETNPVYNYTRPGDYKVELSAWGRGQKKPDTYSEVITIEGLPDPPEAKFSIQNNNVLGPATIIFENNSVNAEEYEWDFGDPDSGNANTSKKANPTHTYQEAGRYKVELTASSSNFKNKSTVTDVVIITTPEEPAAQPIAKFNTELDQNTAPARVRFSNASTDADLYEWNFGDPNSDNNTSSEVNPTHKYSEAGRYEVKLTAINKNSELTNTYSEFVTITPPIIEPAADFIFNEENLTAPVTIKFSNSSENATSFAWDFGDPNSDNNTSSEENPTHKYSEAGRYEVKLTAINKNSELTNTYSEFVTITPPLVEPVADFTFNEENLTAPVTIQFSNSSENATSFAWDFGDPSSGNKNTSTLENPEHLFEDPGKYTVELAVLNKESGKEDAIKKTVTIAKPLEPPEANFEITFNGEYVPMEIDFKNRSVNADSYKWDFGDFDSDNNESSEESPSHYYTLPGKYTITLEAANSQTGELHEISKEITLKSDFVTFVKSDELKGKNEKALSVIPLNNNEYMVLMDGQGKNSSILKMNGQGKITEDKRLNYHLYDGIMGEDGVTFVGLDGTDILIQNIAWDLRQGEPVIFKQNKNFKTDFAAPLIALARTEEIGIVANIINDKYPIDILFQKADRSGRIVPLVDRSFKYVGTKLATDLISTDDGGFAVTGYWKEKEDSPTLILFGKIDRKGHGDIQLISSDMNILGYNIEKSYQGGYAVLRAKESLENNALYEISFILIDSEGGPTDCSTLLPCSIKEEDVLQYRPVLIKSENGYVIASHGFNGLDYDITLFWIDKTGNILEKYENITLPGDQFVMDFKQTNDGGFIISGTQKVDNQQSAVVIKTDSFGKINPKD